MCRGLRRSGKGCRLLLRGRSSRSGLANSSLWVPNVNSREEFEGHDGIELSGKKGVTDDVIGR